MSQALYAAMGCSLFAESVLRFFLLRAQDAALGKRRRLDLYDHAVNSGLVAGQNMARADGRHAMYDHQARGPCRGGRGGVSLGVA